MSRILRVCAKTSDSFSAILEVNGVNKIDYDGYVPDFMPGNHYGDYVEIDIDLDTGQIVNWTVPTAKEVMQQLK